MNQREKVLVGCVGGALGIYLGFTMVKSQIIAPVKQLNKDIKLETDLRDRLQMRVDGTDRVVAAWQKQTGRTLGQEWFDAHQAFREDVGVLLKRNNLTEELKVNKYKERIEKKGARQDFVELPISVRVKGKLADLDNFLKDLFQRPYLVRLDKLQLAAEQTGRSKRGKSKGKIPEPTLGITMTLTTLVLPEIKEVEHKIFDLAALNDPDPEAEPPVVASARLREEDMDAYNYIVEHNPFQIYEEPKQVVVKPPEKEKDPPIVKKTDPPKQPSPPRDPRRDAHKFILTGTANDGEPLAYIINTDEELEPPTIYRLNDEIDDGNLVLVTPTGMVVRVNGDSKRRQSAKNYFYTLGESFKERVEVDPSEHPRISRQLRLVLKR